MDRKRFGNQPCPIARATDIFGDWWVPMILRETLYGVDTFSGFQENLNISRNILNQRLSRLVEAGVFRKELYQAPNRYRYLLTERGRAALAIVSAMAQWSNDWLFDESNYPIEYRDRKTGQKVVPALIDQNTGESLVWEDLILAPGPGFPESKEIRDWRFQSAQSEG